MTGTATKKDAQPAAAQANWEGREPKGSQWKRRSDAASAQKVGFTTVSVKLRPAEKLEFQLACKRIGVSPNRALRSATRYAAGFLEIGDPAVTELKSITRQISGIATNINQIAKAGNRTRNPDYRAFMEDRRELGKEIARLELMMQQILNVGKRRSDGLARLEQAVKGT